MGMKRSLLSLAVQGTITPQQPVYYSGLLAAAPSRMFGAVYRLPAQAVEPTVRVWDAEGNIETDYMTQRRMD